MNRRNASPGNGGRWARRSGPLRAILWSAAGIACLLSPPPAGAHIPHDIIHTLAVSPDFEFDQTLFVVLHNANLRSTDGGASWHTVANGLATIFFTSDIDFSPNYRDDGAVFLSTLGDGVYRSLDRGETWHAFSEGLTDPEITRLYVTAARAIDGAEGEGGETAESESPTPDGEAEPTSTRTVVASARSGVVSVSRSGAPFRQVLRLGGEVTAIAGSGEEYFVIGGAEGEVQISTDGAEAWSRRPLPDGAGSVQMIVVEDAASGVFWVGAEVGLFRTDDHGATYRHITSGLPEGAPITSLAISAETPGRMLCTARHQPFFESTDGGETWRAFGSGLFDNEQAYQLGYPSYRNLELREPTLFMGAYTGLFRSTDEGATWNELTTYRLSSFVGIAFSPNYAADGTIAAVTDHTGIYLSQDRGRSWRPIHRGLQMTNLSAITFTADGRLMVASNLAVYTADEPGAEWERWHMKSVLPWEWLTSWIRPLRGQSEIERFPVTLLPSPDIQEDELAWLGTRRMGILRSSDAGESWEQTWEAGGGYVDSLTLHGSALYAGIRRSGLFRSIDEGESWTPFAKPVAEWIETGKWAKEKMILELSPNFGNDRTMLVAGANGIMRSTDAGATWHSLPSAPPEPIRAIAYSPNHATDRTFFASVEGTGILRTTDDGATFERFGQELTATHEVLEVLAVSPNYGRDGTLVGGSTNALFRSSDRGETWQRLPIEIRFEESDSVIALAGDWDRESDPRWSAGHAIRSTGTSASLSLQFTGTGVRWIGDRSPDHGVAAVRIDGGAPMVVDQFANETKSGETVFVVDNLAHGGHRLELSVHASAQGRPIEVDAFDVMP